MTEKQNTNKQTKEIQKKRNPQTSPRPSKSEILGMGPGLIFHSSSDATDFWEPLI